MKHKKEDREQIEWSGLTWRTQEKWGKFHPDKPEVWYDSKAVAVDNLDVLRLYTDNSPNIFHYSYGKMAVPKIGIGLISSLKQFTYGYFEIEAKMGTGDNLFPAFWMCGGKEDGKPYTEVDVLEMFSEKHNYWSFFLRSPLRWFRDEMRVIWGNNLENATRTHRGSLFSFTPPSDKFVKYGFLWKPDIMQFFRDNRLVYEITDRNILENFTGKKMSVIINNSVIGKEYVDGYETPMIVNYFKYEER